MNGRIPYGNIGPGVVPPPRAMFRNPPVKAMTKYQEAHGLLRNVVMRSQAIATAIARHERIDATIERLEELEIEVTRLGESIFREEMSRWTGYHEYRLKVEAAQKRMIPSVGNYLGLVFQPAPVREAVNPAA